MSKESQPDRLCSHRRSLDYGLRKSHYETAMLLTKTRFFEERTVSNRGEGGRTPHNSRDSNFHDRVTQDLVGVSESFKSIMLRDGFDSRMKSRDSGERYGPQLFWCLRRSSLLISSSSSPLVVTTLSNFLENSSDPGKGSFWLSLGVSSTSSSMPTTNSLPNPRPWYWGAWKSNCKSQLSLYSGFSEYSSTPESESSMSVQAAESAARFGRINESMVTLHVFASIAQARPNSHSSNRSL
ncbi:hypothetical protein KCV07_g529, partial [Aureobasidium melanogenum]